MVFTDFEHEAYLIGTNCIDEFTFTPPLDGPALHFAIQPVR